MKLSNAPLAHSNPVHHNMNKLLQNNIIRFSLPLLLITAGMAQTKSPASLCPKVTINDCVITASDVRSMQKSDSCYGAYTDTIQALIKLINTQLEEEALRLYFHKSIGVDTLKQKSEWVNATTRAPNILHCVQNKFGKDTAAYLYWYIRPTVVNPLLHRLYNFSRVIHKETLQRSASIRDSLDKHLKVLEKFAEYSEWKIPKKMGLSEEERKKYPQEELPFIRDVLRQLKTSETYQGIYEDEYTVAILRLVSEDTTNWYMDGIMLQKYPFDKWYSEQVKATVKIIWMNAAEKNIIKQRYPEWWEQFGSH
jgi:hypothetical protein